MPCAIISRLATENYDTWKAGYDAGEAMRRELGVRGVLVARDATQPHVVTIVTRFDSVDAAKAMLASEAWQKAARSAPAKMQDAWITSITDEQAY